MLRLSIRSLIGAATCAGATLFLSALTAPAFAGTQTLTSTVSQVNVTTTANIPGGLVFTSGSGYDFTGQDYNAFTSIDSLEVTMTIFDGDTGPGNNDRNDLVLGLDGYNTGLVLNGFGNNLTVTLTLTMSGPTNAASVLNALKSDGHLFGSVLDKSPTDGNGLGFSNTYNTTLKITGQTAVAAVPEPGAVATFATLFGGTGLGMVRGRLRRRAR